MTKKAPHPFRNYESSLRADAGAERDAQFESVIRTIPKGKVATYGQVAEAAGYPRYHRAVAKFLSCLYGEDVPWQRVIGAGGEIKIRGKFAAIQRSILKAEGVTFVGKRIDMNAHRHEFEY